MKKYFIGIIVCLFSFYGFNQQGDGGTPRGIQALKKSGTEIPTVFFDQPDVAKLQLEDQINDSLKLGPWRFGYNYATNIDFYNSGKWISLEDGSKIWTVKISMKGAKTINLAFANTEIPNGNELYIYNSQKTFILGKFTENHVYKGELGTELVPGEEIIVEYYVPYFNSDKRGNISISTATYGYRTAHEFQEKAFGSSGNCHLNVNCPDGVPYKDQRNSAVMLVVGNSGFCSGALINNTNFDGKPYVLTANHCYSTNVASWIFRFKWQSTGCQNPSSEPGFESLSGAELKSRRTPSDMCLVEIKGGLTNGTVPSQHLPYFAGWNRSEEPPTATFSIHHPNGDIKKISLDDDAPVAVQAMGSTEPHSSWKVIWDRNTATEGGSSGSPLFNNHGQIIGQLWGGYSGCYNAGTESAYDYYGRISNSWNPNGSSISEQLEHWLDPSKQGITGIYGYNPYKPLKNLDATLLNIQHKDNLCEKSFVPSIEVQNSGSQTLTSFEIKYTYNNSTPQTINWTGNLATHQFITIPLPEFFNVNGNNQIQVEVLHPNAGDDENPSDNSSSVTFQANTSGALVDFEFYMGCWPEEISWDLKDNDGNIIYQGGNYSSTGTNSNFLLTEEFCLTNGCYKLTLHDEYGDGVMGTDYSTCDYDGSMTLTFVHYNEILAQLLPSEANFGKKIEYEFCIEKADLENNHLENNLTIYPNPNKGSFSINTSLNGNKTVIISNISGKIVDKRIFSDGNLIISDLHLAKGIYLVSVSNSRNSITKKLIIE